MDYAEVAKQITYDYRERLASEEMSRAQDVVIETQAAVIETLQQIVKVQYEQIELLKKAQA